MQTIDSGDAGGYLGHALRQHESDGTAAENLFRAYETRDPRFDGRFFVAVRSTKIFCRPVCPARTPKRVNVTFYPSSAAAFEAGYRPCLRCRPERAPAVRGQESGGAALVSRALEAIDGGALNEGSLEDLSGRIGVTARHLRRLFEEHLGASPIAVAQMRRLLFAKQLIEESALPLTQVAFASGFGSVRRFNATLSAAYGRAPGSLRRRNAVQEDELVQLRLGGIDAERFAGLLGFYRARAFAGVESVGEEDYARTIRIGDAIGTIAARGDADGLILTCDFPEAGRLPAIVARVKRMFDLDAPAAAIRAHLLRDPKLKAALQKPALGVPCAWDPYELAVRAVLGQQVSVAAATTLAGRLVAKLGEPVSVTGVHAERLRLAFPRPEVLGAAQVDDLRTIGLVRARAETLISLGRHISTNLSWRERYVGLEQFSAEFCELPGIGPWTAQYVAMRGFADPDAFPSGDLGLVRAAKSLGIAQTPKELLQYAERWRPWRAYAAQTLWNYEVRSAA
ncbi:MAG: transcriptional regulator Ada / DNA-3-methyladenine glycosylase [Betaproteobacteria bacterium]|nr:transcriptional regulator Ada / DNA-3-methyladenine glycosylase [Betaproteobacteria bacterium]